MDLCCNGLQCRQAQDATGLQCRRAGFSPACGTDATRVHWHAHGSHVPQGARHSRPYLVYSYFVLELGQNGYGHLGRYPLVKPLGSIAPFTGHHPITLLFIYELVD